GSLALSGDGECIVLACFTEGLQRYNLAGRKLDRLASTWPCRLVSLSFDGKLMLISWLTKQMLVLDAAGNNLCTHAVDKPLAALALSPLGDRAAIALTDGPILGLDLSKV